LTGHSTFSARDNSLEIHVRSSYHGASKQTSQTKKSSATHTTRPKTSMTS